MPEKKGLLLWVDDTSKHARQRQILPCTSRENIRDGDYINVVITHINTNITWGLVEFRTPAALFLGKCPSAPAQIGDPLKLFRMSSEEVDTAARVVRLIEIPFETPEVETDNACVCVSPPPHTHTRTHTSTACLTSQVYVLPPPTSAYNWMRTKTYHFVLSTHLLVSDFLLENSIPCQASVSDAKRY